MGSSSGPGRVVVTGGAGFIGTHTVRLLAEQGAEVLVVDDLRHSCGVPPPGGVELLEAELASPRALSAVVRFRPTGIVHLAAQGGVSRSLRDPASDATNNVVATVALLRAAVDSGRPRVVFASSGGAIYGRARTLPSHESTRPQPLSPYGAAKLAGEGYLGMFRRTFELPFVALRYGNVYGPHQDGTGEAGMVAISCQRLAAGRAPQVTGDGSQTRDFVFVGDVARANLVALRRPYQGVVNIGTGRPTSVSQIAERLLWLSGTPMAPERIAARPGEVAANYLDPGRAERRLGWRAEVELDSGLAATLSSFGVALAP